MHRSYKFILNRTFYQDNAKFQRFFCSTPDINSRDQSTKVNEKIDGAIFDVKNKQWSVPLSEPLPDLPKPIYSTWRTDNGPAASAVVSTLSNGLRVASLQKHGQFCTVGVCIESGSRYEVSHVSGVCHFLEKLAFGSTKKFQSREDILNRLERFGGICDCQSTRDTFLYAASVDRRGLNSTMEILGDVVLRPNITTSEVDQARSVISFEIEDINRRPEQEPTLTEMLHSAAYSNNTVGLPKTCPIESTNLIIDSTIKHYLSSYHQPHRMVVAGVGVAHDDLVAAGEKYFVEEETAWKTTPLTYVDRSVAQYTGGMVTQSKDLSNVSLGPTPMPELAHVAVGLKGVAHQDMDNFIVCCVLNMMMGGGGSFSAGGPGKGMYTRLYTRVLNRYPWIYSATAFNHSYADAGLFCITASAHPSQLDELICILVKELAILAQPDSIPADELARAKKQLISMLLMNLESRPIIFEDVARQVLSQGKRMSPEHYIRRIESVTSEQIRSLASRMLNSKPSIAAIGTLDKLPEFKDIELAMLNRESKSLLSKNKKSRFDIFRRSR